jgi:caffeic acid 3-O-methyltransferase
MENIAPFPGRTTLLVANVAPDDEDQICLQAQELMFAYNNSLVLRAAIQLGLLDALCTAPTALTADELVSQIKVAADKDEAAASVDRILRYLAQPNYE